MRTDTECQFSPDPANGRLLTWFGDRNEIRLASDGINLYVGTTRNRQAGVAAFQLSPAPAACQ